MHTGSMHSGERWRLGHRPGLDGLRGLAILLVVASHAAGLWGIDRAGATGVVVFFTLSGFLITSLLLDEDARTGRVSLAEFYRRRALRLLPALFMMLAFVTAVDLVLPAFTPPRSQFGAVFYFANWVRAFDAPAEIDALAHTWSLSIEEQFYLVVPLVVIVLRRRPRALVAACLAATLFAVVERAVMVHQAAGHFSHRAYYGTDTRMDSLLLGVALAVVLSVRRSPELGRPTRLALAAVGLGAAGLCSSHAIPIAVFWDLGSTITAAGTVALILVALDRSVFSSRILVWFGQRSYGLYLWHYPLIKLAIRADVPWAIAAPTGVLLGIGVAAVSYRWLEQPFLRLRHRSVGAADTPQRALPGGGQRVVASWSDAESV